MTTNFQFCSLTVTEPLRAEIYKIKAQQHSPEFVSSVTWRMILLTLVLIAFGYLYIANILQEEGSQLGNATSWHRSRVTTVRFEPGDDLKISLLEFIKQHKCSAASIITGVGSLCRVRLRLASASADEANDFFEDKDGRYEIVGLVGTMEYTQESDSSYGHMHISLADKDGKVIGGHLMEGCSIYTTAEVTVMEIPRLKYSRVFDVRSGFKELLVSEADGYIAHKVLRTYEKGLTLLWNRLTNYFLIAGSDTCMTSNCGNSV